jgi:hypothetical protein
VNTALDLWYFQHSDFAAVTTGGSQLNSSDNGRIRRNTHHEPHVLAVSNKISHERRGHFLGCDVCLAALATANKPAGPGGGGKSIRDLEKENQAGILGDQNQMPSLASGLGPFSKPIALSVGGGDAPTGADNLLIRQLN